MRTQLLGGAWCALLCALAACNASDSSDASSATRASTRSSSSASAGSIASAATVAVAFTDSTPTPAAVKSVSVGAGIAVRGNKFSDTATGKPVVLAGANLDGLDGSGGYGGAGQIKQWSIISGITSAQWGVIAAKWGINAIRLPMNSDYWLNPTVYGDPPATGMEARACCYTSIAPRSYTPDASSSYQSVITAIVTH